MSSARMIPAQGVIRDQGASRGWLRWFAGKAWEHLRHSYLWIAMCAWLTYSQWNKPAETPVAGNPAGIQQSAGASTAAPTPAELLGKWSFLFNKEGARTSLEFLPEGKVISRTQGKTYRGQYEVDAEGRLNIQFNNKPLFWDVYPLPNRFAFSGSDLILLTTQEGESPANAARMYRFQRDTTPPVAQSSPASNTAVAAVQ